MTKRVCKHCGLPWRVAALTPCAASESGAHEFQRERNAQTVAAIEESRSGGLRSFATVEELMVDLKEQT